jgi:hypothetical protein
MKAVLFSVVALLVVSLDCWPLDQRLATGLEVSVEQIEQGIRIDGVLVDVKRATGVGVPALVSRITRAWSSEGSMLRPGSTNGWQLASRIHNGVSEVLQWRGEGAQAELLWSALHAGNKAEPDADPQLVLPRNCRWVRRIAGGSRRGRHMEATAACNGSSPPTAAALATGLQQRGWHIQLTSAYSLQGQSETTEGQAIVLPQALPPLASTAAITWIEADRRREGQR